MRAAVLAFFVFSTAAAWVEGTVHGTVRDAVTGKPVAEARVEAAATRLGTLSGPGGYFSLAIPPGEPVTLVVAHPSYRVRRIPLQPPFPAAVEILLEPLVTFRDRVEVTATRAREGVDPVSFTNIPRERIEEEHWGQDPAMLLSAVAPSFYAYNDNGHGIGYSYFTLRGFHQSRTRVTLNGAPLNDAESGNLYFIDLADFLSTAGDIQVQRGVFGLSGIGGAVDITTAPAAVEPGFSFHLGGGSYNTRRLVARYDSGLVGGRWGLTARYSRIETDGYRDQSWVEMWNYFFSLTRFGDRSQVRLVMFGGPERTHLAYNGVPRSVLEGGLTGDPSRDRRFNPLTYPGEIDEFMQPHYQLIHEADLGGDWEFSQTIYAFQGEGYYEQFRTNQRMVQYNLPPITLPDGTEISRTDLVRRRTVDEWDAGWVPSLTWNSGDWTINLQGETRLHRGHHFGDVRWAQHYPEGIDPNRRYYDYQVDKTTATVAMRTTWRATERLDLMAGMGLSEHRYEFHRDELKDKTFTDRYRFVLPRAGAVFHLDENAELYIHAARGMREPNFRNIYDPQDYWGARADLDPEDVWNWEGGVSLRRERWRLRANLFWMHFTNEIVYAGALDDNGVPVYGNGARSRHRGLELDGSWSPGRGWGVDGALTLSRNSFTRYREFGWDGGETVFDGNRIAGFPATLAALTVRRTLGPARIHLTARWVGRFYLDNTQDNRRHPELRDEPDYVPRINPSFATVDLGVRYALPTRLTAWSGLEGTDLEVRLNNLLDREYTSFGYVGGEPLFIPAAPRNLYAGITMRL